MSALPVDPAADLLRRLLAWFAPYPRVLTAYSGGVDSAVVACAAHRVRGAEALACIGVSPSLPARELAGALELARAAGFAVHVARTSEHLDPNYAANPTNRCFFCKDELYRVLSEVKAQRGFDVIVDGTNADDTGDYRPGRQAAGKHGVRSPLLECGFGKAEIRTVAKLLELSAWDKPAMACLSSRVPHGTPVTPEVLAQIERAEDALIAMGFRQMRVRHHGEIARLEVPAGDLARALELREAIVRDLRGAGYKHVTLDLAGFRNEAVVTLNVAGRGG